MRYASIILSVAALSVASLWVANDAATGPRGGVPRAALGAQRVRAARMDAIPEALPVEGASTTASERPTRPADDVHDEGVRLTEIVQTAGGRCLALRVGACGLETIVEASAADETLVDRLRHLRIGVTPAGASEMAAAAGLVGELDIALAYDATRSRLVWEVTSPFQPEFQDARETRLVGVTIDLETGDVLGRGRAVFDGLADRRVVSWSR